MCKIYKAVLSYGNADASNPRFRAPILYNLYLFAEDTQSAQDFLIDKARDAAFNLRTFEVRDFREVGETAQRPDGILPREFRKHEYMQLENSRRSAGSFCYGATFYKEVNV